MVALETSELLHVICSISTSVLNLAVSQHMEDTQVTSELEG